MAKNFIYIYYIIVLNASPTALFFILLPKQHEIVKIIKLTTQFIQFSVILFL
jgi:hypothetical protein